MCWLAYVLVIMIYSKVQQILAHKLIQAAACFYK